MQLKSILERCSDAVALSKRYERLTKRTISVWVQGALGCYLAKFNNAYCLIQFLANISYRKNVAALYESKF